MVRWEYKIVSGNIYDQKYLNSLGDEGWELCGVVTPFGGPVLYFKRKVYIPGPPD